MRLILGSGRSGTTWVLDALADANALRPVFEPLHPDVTGRIGRRYANRRLDPGTKASELREYLLEIDRGWRGSLWTDYRFRKDKLWRDRAGRFDWLAPGYRLRSLAANVRAFRAARRRRPTLIKCIRANLMTDWLAAAFDARMLLVVRHPCAVLDSKLRLGRAWDPAPVLARYRADPALAAVLGRPYRHLLARPLGDAAAHALVWCIENALPLELGLHERCRVVHFEELTGPDAPAAWRAATDWLELERVPEMDALRRPSAMSSLRWRSVAPSTDLNRGWRARLPRIAIDDTERVLAAVGCTLYSVDDDRPQRAA